MSQMIDRKVVTIQILPSPAFSASWLCMWEVGDRKVLLCMLAWTWSELLLWQVSYLRRKHAYLTEEWCWSDCPKNQGKNETQQMILRFIEIWQGTFPNASFFFARLNWGIVRVTWAVKSIRFNIPPMTHFSPCRYPMGLIRYLCSLDTIWRTASELKWPVPFTVFIFSKTESTGSSQMQMSHLLFCPALHSPGDGFDSIVIPACK